MSAILENIIKHGNRAPLDSDLMKAGVGVKRAPNEIECKDGFTVSVIAGDGAYCSPRPSSLNLPCIGEVSADYKGPFQLVEVGFPSVRPEPWGKWEEYCESPSDPTGTVYGYVPAQLVRDLVALHGGEVA